MRNLYQFAIGLSIYAERKALHEAESETYCMHMHAVCRCCSRLSKICTAWVCESSCQEEVVCEHWKILPAPEEGVTRDPC